MANTRLPLAGGSPPNDHERTWTIRKDLGFFAVVSPLGGTAQDGAVALESITACLKRQSAVHSTFEHPACAKFREAILATDAEWQRQFRREPSGGGPVATFAGILLREDCAAVAHLGHCRAALIRGGQMSQRTTDHSQVVRNGRVAILRALGMDSNPEIHLWQTCDSDVLVITSGVHDVVDEDEIVGLVCQNPDSPARVASTLTELAITRGGKEHLVAVVVRV